MEESNPRMRSARSLESGSFSTARDLVHTAGLPSISDQLCRPIQALNDLIRLSEFLRELIHFLLKLGDRYRTEYLYLRL